MNWLELPAARALAQALLHFLWQGALIAVVLAAALGFARGSSRARHALAMLTMLAMPLAFIATFTLLLPGRQEVLSTVRATGAGTPAAAASLPLAPAASWRFEDSLPWAVPVWMAGVLACYLRCLIGWIAAQRMRRVGVCDPPPEWRARVDYLARRLRVSRPVLLLESALAEVPVVIGFVRPIILMPAALLAGLPPAQVEAILIHELAHIRRWDYLVNLAQSVVEGLLFYHPAVWWVGSVIRTERENCCDNTVLEIAGDPRGYAAALATLEEIRCASREPAMAATGGNLMQRIRRILRQPDRSRGTISPALCSGVLLVLAAAVLAAWPMEQPPAQQKTGRAPVTPGAPEASPYRKWLDEDVTYIVTDAERAEFKSLTSNQEFERFIEEFWLRRDPTSATAVNEFKEEHYRRIAYANERFAAAIPGWKTDRGRIYITYGPPDEKESHPAGDAGRAPYEAWKYRHIEGIGDSVIIEFRDSNRDGEYRMTKDPRVVVQGEVRKPGAHTITGPTTVLQMLVNSGGFRENANRKQIVIQRGQIRFNFNYDEVIQGTNRQQNILLDPGDLIIVR